MKPAHYVRIALRESRRSAGRIGLFMACIAIGVAAIVIVAGLSSSVTDGIRAEGRRLMAGDISIEGRREMPAELDEILARAAQPIVRSDVRELVSIVVAERGTLLAELKVVDRHYPFYGGLRLDPDRQLPDLLTPDTVVIAPELMKRLELRTGDELRLGGVPFRVAGVVLEEPDKLSISFTLGPRVFLSHDGLARTALARFGSRIEHRALLKLPPGSTADHAQRVEQIIQDELPDDEQFRVRSFSEAQPQLRRSFDRMGRFLGLVSLLSLLIGGLGVAQVARAWLNSRMDDIAIMRCLGARPREVIMLFMAQVLAMALLACLLGAAIGTALHAMLPWLLRDMLPAGLMRPWQPAAVGRGVMLGMAVAIIFTLPLLVGLRRVPPVRVLRRDAEPVRSGWIAQALAAMLILAGVWFAASAQAESYRLGSVFAVGLVIAVLLLALAAALVTRIARLLPRDTGGMRLRHGLTHLARPGAATIGAIVALGLGVTFVFATRVVQRHLNEQLQAELPADAPTTFFVDVQPDQWEGLQQLLTGAGAIGVESRPIVTARIAAINGISVTELRERRDERGESDQIARSQQPRPRRWILAREHRLTYGEQLPRGNRVTAGQFPAPPAIENGVSIEEGFAADLGVAVGSTITFDVQGVPIDFTVASLRTVEWRTMGLNFFLFAEPGPLDDAPQMRVAVARLENRDLPRVQSAVVQRFPNITVIHTRDVMDKVLAVLGRLGLAVQVLGGFIVIAGIVVLGGTVAATQARRAREVALLKTVGMTRRDVAAVYTIEYALTGLVAAAIGIAAGALLAWGMIHQLMELPWRWPTLDATVALALTVTLAIAAGLLASARALASRPIEALRHE
jgi:putative ABC transport system permease protein